MATHRYHIIYESPDFIAVDKPAGLLTIPDREQTSTSLKELLQAKYGMILTVHRLDRDTSGLVIFARNEEWHKYLCRLFEDRSIRKTYLGIVVGMPSESSGDIEAPIMEDPLHPGRMIIHRNGKPSHTSFEVLESFKPYSLVRFNLHTGRTHQIRLHARHIGYPLACDPLYGDGKPVLISSFKKKFNLSKSEEQERPMINRLALHAYQLSLPLPSGTMLELEAAIPKEFRALMQQLAKYAK